MSAIGNYLTRYLKQTGEYGYEVANRMAIPTSHFSGFKNGHITNMNPETLAKMVIGISDDPTVRAGLLHAYFQDQTLPEFKPWIHVVPDTRHATTMQEDSPERDAPDDIARLAATLRVLHLPTHLITALQKLVVALPENAGIEAVILGLAELTDKNPDSK